jgi:hypothetical protein
MEKCKINRKPINSLFLHRITVISTPYEIINSTTNEIIASAVSI